MMLKIAARVVGSTAHLLAVVAAIVTPFSFYAIAKDCCAWPMDQFGALETRAFPSRLISEPQICMAQEEGSGLAD